MTKRGKRRGDTALARTLALFDTLHIRKRSVRTHVTLSTDGYAELERRALSAGISAASFAAYLIESACQKRDRDRGYEDWRDQHYGASPGP